MTQEVDQKLKLSASNIFALIAICISLFGGFINLKSTQTELNQRITTLEKANDESKVGFGKFDFKLDKINESLNQLKVDMAGQRVKDIENKR